MKTADLIVHTSISEGEKRIAAYQLVEYLERLGVEVIFGLCGHTVIAFLDALRGSRIKFISTRHEQVAAHAADGYARASGKPGVLMTHLGPGLTNAATGVANAALDSIPMVVIAGDVPSHYFGRHPHQEVNLHMDADQYEIYRPFCKRIYRVDRVADLPRIVERAFHLSQAGRPGPVLVDVPMDIFSADLPVGAFSQMPAPIVRPALDASTAERIAQALAEAERPVLYVGGGVLGGRATTELVALAEALEVPVAHTLMGKGCMREDHPLLLGMTGFWGTPIANETCRTADLIVAVGTRLAEANSSSWDPRFTFDIPPTRLIHIDIDVTEIGRNFPTELGRRRRLPDGAKRDRLRRSRQESCGPRRPAPADCGRPRRIRVQLGGPVEFGPIPDAPGANSQRVEEGDTRRRLHRHRRGLEQKRRRTAVPHHGPRHVRHSERSGDDGVRSLCCAGCQNGAAISRRRSVDRRRGVRQQSVGGGDRHGSGARGSVAGDGQLGVRDHCRTGKNALRHQLRMPVRTKGSAL